MTRRRADWWKKQLLASKAQRRKPPAVALSPPAPALSLSLAVIRSRSTSPCAWCEFHSHTRGVPCLEHTLPTERAARAKTIGVVK